MKIFLSIIALLGAAALGFLLGFVSGKGYGVNLTTGTTAADTVAAVVRSDES